MIKPYYKEEDVLSVKMASLGRGYIVNCLYPYFRHGNMCLQSSIFQLETTQVRSYAARKGTREKARKKKVKVEVQKVGFIPHNLRDKNKLKEPITSKRMDDSMKGISPDNVWLAKYYKWRIYSFAEAIHCHQETHHPTIYNMPNAIVNATIELDMHAEKKNRILDNFTRMVAIPHPFDHGEDRSIVAFCKSPELQKSALEAGASLAGGAELIKDIQTGALSMQDFQFVVAHPEILPDLATVRGLMKRKFPNPKSGTLGTDFKELVHRFLHGINYTSTKDEHEEDFGWIETSIGTLNMDITHLEANFAALVKDVNSIRPKRNGPFITRIYLKSPPSIEKLKVDIEPYIGKEDTGDKEFMNKEEAEEEEEDEEQEEKGKKSAATSG